MASSTLGSSVLAGAAVLGLGVSFAYRAWQGGKTGDNVVFPTQHDSSAYRTAKLVSTRDVGAGAKILKFRYDGPAGFAPVKPFSHLTVRGKTFDVPPEYPFGLKVEREYTPISASRNEFELLVKRYSPPSSADKANKTPTTEFSKYGLTSKFLLGLETGKTVEVRGPIQSVYVEHVDNKNLAAGQAAAIAASDLRDAVQQRKFVGMVAAGSGITPMVQLLKNNNNVASSRKFSILWSNKSLDDAFYLKDLDKLKNKHVSVRMTLTRTTPPGWQQDTGRVSKELLRARMPPPGPECLIVVCGPDEFVQAVAGGKRNAEGKWVGPIGGFLQELDYSSEHVLRL